MHLSRLLSGENQQEVEQTEVHQQQQQRKEGEVVGHVDSEHRFVPSRTPCQQETHQSAARRDCTTLTIPGRRKRDHENDDADDDILDSRIAVSGSNLTFGTPKSQRSRSTSPRSSRFPSSSTLGPRQNEEEEKEAAQTLTTRPPESLSSERLHTTKLLMSLHKTLQTIRKEGGTDHDKQRKSIALVTGTGKATCASSTSNAIDSTSDFAHYLSFCASLKFPPFPLTPVKVALSVARYVSLPISSEMRRCSNVKETWTAPDRVEPALKHLRTIAIRTAGLWTGVSNFVERPERYVLFVEIVEDANQMMGKRYVRGTTTASVPSIRLWSPDQKPKQENAMPTVSAAATSTNTRRKLELGKVRLKRPLVPSMPARLRVNPVERRASPDTKELFSGYSCHAKEANTTEFQTSDAPNELDMYYDADIESPVSYDFLLRDIKILVQDIRSRERPSKQDGLEASLTMNAAFTTIDKLEARRLKEVSILYMHLASLISFRILPITPLKMVLFAFAYSPLSKHVALFDNVPAAGMFCAKRIYPRLRFNEVQPALSDLEKLLWAINGSTNALSACENLNWSTWKAGILRDLHEVVPKPPHTQAQAQPRPANSRADVPASAGLVPAALTRPLLARSMPTCSAKTQDELTARWVEQTTKGRRSCKRRKICAYTVAQDTRLDQRAAPMSTASSRESPVSPTSESNSASRSSDQDRPPGKRLSKGWIYRAPSPPRERWIPVTKGSLCCARRIAPPLPLVLPCHRSCLASEEGLSRTSRASRPRRRRIRLPKMVEWVDESASEGDDGAASTGLEDDSS